MARIKMRWLGNGFYIGIPARDLTTEEVKRFGHEFLLSLGLYEEVVPIKAMEPEDDKIEEVENDRSRD